MPDFTEADFFKCLECDMRVQDRPLRDEITHDLMAEFYRKLGATPGFVRQALPVLVTLPVEKIRDSLAKIGPEAAADQDESDDKLGLLQQEYFAELILPELYLSLSVSHRSALSRLAVSSVPLPEDDIVAMTGFDAGFATTEFGPSWGRVWSRLERWRVYGLRVSSLLICRKGCKNRGNAGIL